MTIHGFPPPLPQSLTTLIDIWQRRRADLDALKSATQTGNAVAAQNATAPLGIDAQSATASGVAGSGNGVDQFRSDIKSLIDAVRSGDLPGAQKAIAALEQDMPSGYGPQSGTPTAGTWSITITFTAASASGSAANNGTATPASGTTLDAATSAAAPADPDGDGDTHAAGSTASPTAATTPAPGAPVAQNPFKALFDAVKAGDITAAQQALGAIETAMQQMHGHHHHHHHGHAQAAEGATSATDATTAIRKPGAVRDGGPQPVADAPTPPTTTEFLAPNA